MTDNQKQLNEQLFKAIEQNNIEELKHIIEQGADLEASNIYGFTPVTCAVFLDRPNCLKLLIEAGADINAKDIDDCTPLHWAAAYDHVDCIIFLLEKGADKNAEDDALQTPFNYLSETTQIKLINRIEDRIEQLLQMQRGKNV